MREEDFAGRDRMARNVLASWGSYLVIAATGFVLPRMMDRYLGQTALGVWDFGWSLVSYFSLASIGIGASVNRYVARHRATGDVQGLRRNASSVICISLLAGLFVLSLTALATWAVPWMLGLHPSAYLGETRWVVALLGVTLAVHLVFDLFGGILTGCHRWDLHNAITAGFHLATTAAMIAVLLGGGGLRGLALANLGGQIGGDLTRLAVAYRICPELRIRFAYATIAEAREVLAFGAKTSLGGLSLLVLFQTNSLIVGSALGLPMLALFARPLALLKVAQTFAGKFALVLTPTASSLQGAGRHQEVRQLVIESTRFGTALAAPMTLGLAILGDPILRFWMGSRYEQGLVLAILAIGSFIPLTQVPVGSILIGLNLHGPVVIARVAAAALGVGLGLINVWLLGWDLVGAALAVALPFTAGSGIFIALYACRRLGISLREYVRQGLLVPTAWALPFALVLAASRILLAERPLLSVLCGSAAGALVLAPLYWRHVLPGRVRESVSAGWARVLGRLDSRPT